MRVTNRVLIGGLVLALAVPATPAVAKPAPAKPAAANTDKPTIVTLITGDRVRLDPAGVEVEPAPRVRPVPFTKSKERGDWYVVPADAAPLLQAGVLDRRLFNVTGLVRQGYDDAHTDSTPLLIEPANARSAAAPAGARAVRALPALNLTAVAAPKAGPFWSSVGAQSDKRTLTGGAKRIWLNGKVRGTLDRSVPQVGAPAAWQAGYTGRGVTVAVLDSGYDTDHADLAGRIGPTKNFTAEDGIEDRAGHGTHVASIALGSGAASAGKYRGVAPDATLAVGKVLDRSGSGTVDAVLAAMVWASTEVKAKVVNMSLGYGQTDGTDPLSTAVNQLSRAHGTLFVAAAGNSGAAQTIDTPGAADEALAVGSVDKSDVLSDFSSHGPRRIDFAPKPEIVAPGSEIIAAKASEATGPILAAEDEYLTLSGTSMATPHVAGAAALLAQQHPDWSGARIKAALTNSAKPLPAYDANEVGAGRLDLARAITQQVTASPTSVHTYFAWPHATTPPQRRPITYRNDGAAPITLDLALRLTDASGQPAPAGLATLDANRVTVPAGGTATVALTVNKTGKTSAYAGILVATGPAGAVTVRTPVGTYQEPERYDLTVRLRDRAGTELPYREFGAQVLNLETGEQLYPSSGERLRLPPARYAVFGNVDTPRAGLEPSQTLLVHPELTLDHDTTVELDARIAHRVRTNVDQPAATAGTEQIGMIVRTEVGPVSVATGNDRRWSEYYAASVPGVTSAGLTFTDRVNAEEPTLDLTAVAPQPFPVRAAWYFGSPRPNGVQRLAAVHGGDGTPEALAKVKPRGKLVVLRLTGDPSPELIAERIGNVAKAGGKAALLDLPNQGLRTARQADEQLLPIPTLYGQGITAARFGEQAAAGGLSARLTVRAGSRYRYELASTAAGTVPTELERNVKRTELATVKARYYGTVQRSVTATADVAGMRLDGPFPTPVAAASERVEYFSPGSWTLVSQAGDFGSEELRAGPISLVKGPARRIDWNKGVFGPAFGAPAENPDNRPAWAFRSGDLIDVNAPLYTDAAGHARGPAEFGDTDTGSTSLYRDGTLLETVPTPGRGAFWVPAEPADYRLTTESTRDQPWWPLATRVSASWTFRSATVDGRAERLPLLAVRYEPQLDLANKAPGGWAFRIPIRVERQDGSGTGAVTGLTVDVSYDDGQTWTTAPVTAQDQRWSAVVRHPARGFVSLRARASDAAGNTVEQTVIRAYQL